MSRRGDMARQSGMTMVEMSITTMILSIVLAAFFMSFGTAQTTSDNVDSRLQHLGEAQKLMRATSKDVRTATKITELGTPFVIASKYRLKFYADIEQGGGPIIDAPYLIDLFVDSTDPFAPVLKELSTPANYTGTPPTAVVVQPLAHTENATRTKVRFIGTYLFNSAIDRPIFTYLDVNGTPLPFETSGNLDPSRFASVRAIQIELHVKKTKGRPVGATTLQTTVRLPNVIYGRPSNT